MNTQTFYHGTSKANLTEILPPATTGNIQEVGRKKNLNKVFFTTSYKSALIYAKRDANVYGGKPVVHVVLPVGQIDCLNCAPGTDVYFSDKAIVLN